MANSLFLGKRQNQPIRWFGGKGNLADKIVQHFPDRDQYDRYCECFAGGLSVLFRHDPEGKAEVVNDLYSRVSNFWDVMRDPDQFNEFVRLVEATPLSEVVFQRCRDNETGTPVEKAFSFFVQFRQSRQGLGECFATPTRRIRTAKAENVSAWLGAIAGLRDAHQRLIRVEVRNLDAVNFIHQYDFDRCLFYCDPPYLKETRTSRDVYRHEMTLEDHERLLDCLAGIEGKFMLSGYPHPLYDDWARQHGFRCESFSVPNNASAAKTKQRKWK
jgi:DNA adenine methylase